MDQLPKRFPREIVQDNGPSIFGSHHGLKGLEDTTSMEDALFFIKELRHILKEQGLDLTRGLKVLEIGSGNATLLDLLNKNGAKAVGVDVDPRGGKESSQVLARVEQLPFSDGFFKVVLSRMVFQPVKDGNKIGYLQDKYLMIKEIARVLESGGMYVGFEPIAKLSPSDGLELISDPNSIITVYKKS